MLNYGDRSEWHRLTNAACQTEDLGDFYRI